MTTVACIVEGDGERVALPILLRRICEWRTPGRTIRVVPPQRVRRDRFLNKEDEFRWHLLLAALKSGEDGWILVLLDADDDCPAEMDPRLLARVKAVVPHRNVSVVLANREYEAWLIAAARSLHGHRGFQFDESDGPQPEAVRNAKGWLQAHMLSRAYREITDQPAFTARFDLQQAFENSRSFRKLCDERLRQMA